MRNISLEKSYTKCGKETIPRPFSEKSKNTAGSIVKSIIQFIFIVCQAEGYRNILKPSCRPLVIMSYKAFLKKKKRSGTSIPASISA